MPAPLTYSDEQKKEWVQLINDSEGNIRKAHLLIKEKGTNVSYPTFREAYVRTAQNRPKREQRVNHQNKRITKREIKDSLRMLEANAFNYKVTLKQINELGVRVADQRTLKRWWIEYGKEILNTKKFNNTINGLSSRLATEHEAMASKVYSVRNEIIDRMAELIPKEKDLNKLSNAYKALSEVIEGKNVESPLQFIQQYNAYYNDKKNTNPGDVQDVTPVNE